MKREERIELGYFCVWVIVVARSSNWVEVRLGGGVGWMMSSVFGERDSVRMGGGNMGPTSSLLSLSFVSLILDGWGELSSNLLNML